jgi:hypothetical protein
MNRRTFCTAIAVALAGCTTESTTTTDGALDVQITDGAVSPAETVTLRVTQDGSPVQNATVRLDYQQVGTTNETGHLTVTLPREGDDAAIDVEKGDREGELAIEFGSDAQATVDEVAIAVVEGTPEPGATITIEVTADGEPITGAEIEVHGETVGVTDADGRLTVTLPETADDEVRIEADSSDLSGELTVTFED